MAAEMGKPLIIHSRQAEEDVLRLLEENRFDRPIIFHCYTGSLDHARRILDMGGYLSFSGIITFPKAEALREVLQQTPVDRLFIETDAPYLAPVPERGKRNSPLFLPHTLRRAAEVKDLGEAELIEAVDRTFSSVFGSVPV
jgi:TatD DNase family protein